MSTLMTTNFNLKGQKKFYKGKVRDVYFLEGDKMAMVVSDRISAFDIVLPKGIPYKGQILNLIASKFLDETKDIVPNWKISTPHPNVTFGHFCEPYPVEMIIRGYLTGSSWRTYKTGKRDICGVPVPDNMKEHDPFPTPIITPTTKATEGHDEDITREQIISQGLIPENEYIMLEKYSLELFKRGTEIAAKQGLILVDTKYEFGKKDNNIYLIDEIHTPDSSRYFYLEGYQERQAKGENQRQLSKEFVREWLMENGFKGETGQKLPEMTDDFCNQVSNRYIELFETVTGEKFNPHKAINLQADIEEKLNSIL